MAVKEKIRGQEESRVKLPRQYQVWIYNDDFTPMDFVVEILVRIFDKEEAAAVALMLDIHKGSHAVAGVYPRDIAQTKAAEAVWLAREAGYPLKVEAVCL
ncbi:MAG: ATP-dependent Clp protease adaptor ClpS [Lachnospiraceae bacterium]|nr:ATP-dependent Clp protease adaptor ClpS [Lachnospiraceae bacterium]MCI9183910.1 ATP-dependent Clp protease adaptor ClpS [Lachnospiraceae bacterium]